jgi:hypothetical protein
MGATLKAGGNLFVAGIEGAASDNDVLNLLRDTYNDKYGEIMNNSNLSLDQKVEKWNEFNNEQFRL